MPATGVGSAWGEVSPSPSWPWSLYPQHETSPPVESAHTWSPPTATLRTLLIAAAVAGSEGAPVPTAGAPRVR